MSASEKTESAKSGLNPPATRHAARPGRLLSVVRGSDERALHLSPILQKIKDDGPALIDGEVVPDGSATPRLGKRATATITKAETPVPAAPVVQPLLGDKHIKILLGFCAALTLGLACSLYFSYQQQARLESVEALLYTIVADGR